MNFDEIYERLFKPVLAYLRSRISTAEAAEDINSRVWQKAWEKQTQYDPGKGLPDQWIFTIARNEANKYFSFWHLKRFFSITEEEETLVSNDKTPFEQLEQEEKNHRLLQAMRTLNAREKDIISLKFYGGFNNREIAQITQLSESNVGTIAARAIQKLRTYMEEL